MRTWWANKVKKKETKGRGNREKLVKLYSFFGGFWGVVELRPQDMSREYVLIMRICSGQK